ncbi:MAG: anthranilate phosphoribosyltransferase [Gallicola sp.]|nr:anthranilate phosphoribosyltransferase [Gallicola sp.]
MLKTAVEKASKNVNLSEDEMIYAMNDIMEGKASQAQIGGLLMALRTKGETVDEITGSAKLLRIKSRDLGILEDYGIDTCGTGGDCAHTFNISTTVSFVAAAAGVKVFKHGGRSVSSSCGSADVLEALGVNIHLSPEEVKKCVERLNIGFMFAPDFNPAMKHAQGARKELGVRTIFNILGPLINPGKVKGQVLGVFDENMTETLAEVLKNIGTERAVVVHGMDGLDEITITDQTKVSELKEGKIKTYFIEPEQFSMDRALSQDLVGGDAEENAEILKRILQGEKGPKRDIVFLNAGAAIYVGKKADSIEEGIQIAKEMIDSGKAFERLKELIALTQEENIVFREYIRI